MRATGRNDMEKKLPRSQTFWHSAQRIFTAGMSLVFVLSLAGTALAQQVPVSGVVTSSSGPPLRGVTVRVSGTDIKAVTDANGKYSLTAPSDAVLSFSLLGRRAVQQGVLGRSTINVTMDPVAFLEEVTVTGYSEQRRADITGAVASVNVEAADRQTSASVLQRLDATVSG